MNDRIMPEWAEPDNKEFTSFVMKGVKLEKNESQKKVQRKNLEIKDYVQGVLDRNVMIISKTITLVESNNPQHIEITQQVLKDLLPHTGNSIRIGITGPPGAGKSTFIEAFGNFLCNLGKRVAVLAIDPSSTITGGSILGDKTRMEILSRQENAFIRPSPSGGTLGGVAKKTRETILICEAAGYDVILIETIGVGQSEITVRSMVDFFMLMLLPGSGDELQGIKKGVVEIADCLVVNKADGNYKDRANMTKAAYSYAVHLLTQATSGWITEVTTCSALNNEGIDNIWQIINKFEQNTKSSGVFDSRRKEQLLDWMHSMLEEALKTNFFSNPKIKSEIPNLKNDILEAKITPTTAVQILLNKAGLI